MGQPADLPEGVGQAARPRGGAPLRCRPALHQRRALRPHGSHAPRRAGDHTDRAVGALFARNIFLRPDRAELSAFEPGWTILHAPDVQADPEDGTHTTAFIITHLGQRTTIIGGTRYNGQIKKSIFAVQNLLLPLRGILTMHAGASEGEGGRAAIHAGLSGTGKTTLSNTGFPVADDQIIIDVEADEDAVITNMEGGQYAKTENLRRDKEPRGLRRDPLWHDRREHRRRRQRRARLQRPVHHGQRSRGLPARVRGLGQGERCLPRAPTASRSSPPMASACLPPLARLTPEGAMYHFAMGFTSKMPGTEEGVNEPKPTFSAFFGKPFMPLKPVYYTFAAQGPDRALRHQRVAREHRLAGPQPPRPGSASTSWSARPSSTPCATARWTSRTTTFVYDERFKLLVPRSVPGVDDTMLDPRNAWEDMGRLRGRRREAGGHLPSSRLRRARSAG